MRPLQVLLCSLAAVTLLRSTSPVQAQAVGAQSAAAPSAPRAEAPLSPGLATGLAAAGTVVPLLAAFTLSDELATVGAVSLILTPSMGHWYAGRVLTWGMAFRLAGAGYVVAVARGTGDEFPPLSAFTAGFLLMATGAIVDIATAGGAACDRNSRLRLSPTVILDRTKPIAGVAASFTF